jgi:ribosomal protein S18 acetylase RimI-like enzyme
MTIVRPLQSHEWQLYRELRLTALRDAPNAFGSTLAREQGFADQEWIARLANGATSHRDRPLIAEDSGRAIGLAWVRIDADDSTTATLYQVWVHPDARRCGIGRRLLDAAMTWARDAGAKEMVLSVVIAPDSALEFYREAGFSETGEPTPFRMDSDLLQQPMRRNLQRG